MALAIAVAGCGGKSPPAGSLATGLTEYAPAVLAGPGSVGLRPRYARVVVLWSAVQPRAGAAPDWDARGAGGFSVRAQLLALRRARERAGGGFEPVATFLSTPAWAARSPSGCLPPGGGNVNARAPTAAALADYRAMVESFLALARAEGVPVRYLSAWNEPNSGLFLAPQRARCAPDAPSLAAAEYAPLVRALRAALDAAPGAQEVVVGEASSPYAAHPGISTVDELVRALPDDVMCAGPIWAQHQYAGDADGVAAARDALAAREACPGGSRLGTRMWVTETGAGAPRPGDARPSARESDSTPASAAARSAPASAAARFAPASAAARSAPPDPASLRAGCRSLADLLDRWYRDPRVEAAFQYTLRDDPNFPVGLATAAGSPAYPAYELWRAWGARPRPTAPPPALPAACR